MGANLHSVRKNRDLKKPVQGCGHLAPSMKRRCFRAWQTKSISSEERGKIYCWCVPERAYFTRGQETKKKKKLQTCPMEEDRYINITRLICGRAPQLRSTTTSNNNPYVFMHSTRDGQKAALRAEACCLCVLCNEYKPCIHTLTYVCNNLRMFFFSFPSLILFVGCLLFHYTYVARRTNPVMVTQSEAFRKTRLRAFVTVISSGKRVKKLTTNTRRPPDNLARHQRAYKKIQRT